MFVNYNANPNKSRVGDCVVRAISTALGRDWKDVYMELAELGMEMGDMPSSNHVWGMYLYQRNFDVKFLPNFCPGCYTVEDFARDHPYGTYVLGTGSHAVAVISGDYIDAYDSGRMVPIYYFVRR